MSLEQILAAITARGEAEIAAIEADAGRKVAAIERETAAEAAHRQDSARQQIREMVPIERDHRLQRAKLETVRIIGSGREQIVSEILDQARQALGEARRQPDYPDVLHRLLEEAVAAVNQDVDRQRLILAADPRDQPLLDPLIDSLAIRYDLTTWGGVKVMTWDERITVDNTLETRFRRSQGELRRRIAALFADPNPLENA